MFSTIDAVKAKFLEEKYICSREIATVVFLASQMEKPILVEGPAGVGKTELAKVLAASLERELVRLQCYEGLDESKALYEWKYAKQLLYSHILKEKTGEVIGESTTLKQALSRLSDQEEVFFSDTFLLPRPLLRAILSPEPVVLLIDEIDRADQEFEAFLLEVLSDFQVSVPELGTLMAVHRPIVILTSNNTREMSDALKRRCLHLFLTFPSREQELQIVRLKTPGITEKLAGQLVDLIQNIRQLDVKKMPSISETLDWAKALTILNRESLDQNTFHETLNLILKYEGDIEKVKKETELLWQKIDSPMQ